jgi:hypothetical protein
MTLRMQDVWRRVGVRRLPSPHSFQETEWRLHQVKSPQVGIVFYWKRVFPYLRLRAWHAAPGQEEKEFRSGAEALAAVFDHFNTPPGLPPGFFEEHEVIAAVVSRTAGSFRLLVCVDTDDPDFLRAARASEATGRIEARIPTLVLDGERDEAGEIRLEMEPCKSPELYHGFGSIDLGNTSSTLAAHPGFLIRSGNVAIVDGEAVCGCIDSDMQPVETPRVDSADSSVRIDVVDREYLKEQALDHPDSIVWSVGARALEQTGSDGLVLGAKRMVAGRDYGASYSIHAHEVREYRAADPRRPIPLPRRLPAELLLCRLLQRFQQTSLREPPKLALTYPTSYSRREIEQLREVATRAVCRLKARPQSPQDMVEYAPLIHRMIDEASAAAYYFLFHDLLETRPGLLRFRYLYPKGYNLLLYDCGGGTTDLCLVRAAIDPKNRNVLLMEVRGRSGVRNFGGDNVTLAVYRLLKTGIAARVQEIKGSAITVRVPQDQPGTLDATLRGLETTVDTLVPTRYDRNRMNGMDRRNRNHTRHLWQRATAVKHALEKGDEHAAVAAFGPTDRFDDSLSKYLLEETGLTPDKQSKLRDALRTIKIRRKDIDVLIRDDVMRSIQRANWLIKKKMARVGGTAPDGGMPEDVQRFVLLGNGSRYPLIEQLLREHLNVMFFDDRLRFDKDNLKTAVAKGAVLALATELAAPDIRIEFDWSMADELPFDVGYTQWTVGGAPNYLFFEGENYKDIAERPQTIEVLLPPEDRRRARNLQLVRRWPGETKEEEYLAFDFERGIEGPLTLEYDAQVDFKVTDSNGAQGKLIETMNQDVYLHPVERGTL